MSYCDTRLFTISPQSSELSLGPLVIVHRLSLVSLLDNIHACLNRTKRKGLLSKVLCCTRIINGSSLVNLERSSK